MHQSCIKQLLCAPYRGGVCRIHSALRSERGNSFIPDCPKNPDTQVCRTDHSHPVQYVGTPAQPDATDSLPWATICASKCSDFCSALKLASTSLLPYSSGVGSTESCALKDRPPQLCTPPNAFNNPTAGPHSRYFTSAW